MDGPIQIKYGLLTMAIQALMLFWRRIV